MTATPTRFRTLLPTLAVVACVAGALGAVAALSQPAAEPPHAARPVAVLTEPVRWTDSIEVRTRYLGEVRARQRVELSFEITGTIESVLADEGDVVEGGLVVAELDTSRLEADLDRARAAAAGVRTDLNLARRTFERVERIFSGSASTQQELDEASNAVRRLEARLAEAEATIRLVKVDLEKSSLEAPFDAIVSRRAADVGSLASPGAIVLTLLETEGPEVRIGVSADAASSLGAQKTVTVRGRSVPATVLAVLPSVDRLTRTTEVRLRLGERLGSRLRDGDAATIELSSSIAESGFWVPLSALTQSVRGLWALYIATPEERGWILERREVEIMRPGSERAYVRGSIREGEAIVVDGKQRLVPGMRVRPASSGEPEGGRGG
ncbi:MAG: efflux RND transporter periplasmic adaptor subunit [Planctomycetota bacterium]